MYTYYYTMYMDVDIWMDTRTVGILKNDEDEELEVEFN